MSCVAGFFSVSIVHSGIFHIVLVEKLNKLCLKISTNTEFVDICNILCKHT